MHSEPERPLPLIEFRSLEPPDDQIWNPSHRSCPEIGPQIQIRLLDETENQSEALISERCGETENGSIRGGGCHTSSSGGNGLGVLSSRKHHLWPSHARSGLSSRLEHSFLTRTISRESVRTSTQALSKCCCETVQQQTCGSGHQIEGPLILGTGHGVGKDIVINKSI